MKGLSTLVRARRRALDEKRRALGRLEDQAEQLNRARAALADERRSEAETVRGSADGGYGYGGYLAGARLRDAALRRDLQVLAGRIDAMRDEIAGAFAEIKRFELIEAAQVERARAAAARREQQELDELGLDMFRRGGPDGN